jgi:TPR repeat protein
MTKLGWLYQNGEGVPQDYAKAREWFEKAADKGNEEAMTILGQIFAFGLGVRQDSAKAREWWEKVANKGDALAMTKLGWLYETGRGVTHDYSKAREWYEKAAAKNYADAMFNLGRLYANGHGVARDYAKAREWWEKAAAKGDEDAKEALERLSIREAFTTARYAEALQRQEALAAKLEAEETKRNGKPGVQTAPQLNQVIWYALFAKEFTKALTVADRSHALFPDNLLIETNRAHALMFMERREEAKALYLARKGQPMSEQDNRLWEDVIINDFAELRSKAGLTHPTMADIEKELGVSPDGNSDIGQRY